MCDTTEESGTRVGIIGVVISACLNEVQHGVEGADSHREREEGQLEVAKQSAT